MTPTNQLKIGILVLYGPSTTGEWGEDVMSMVMKNRHDYAKRHGYEIINGNSEIDPTRPVAWSKLLAIKKFLPHYDYIFYIDTDAVFMNPSIRLEDLIAAGDSGYAEKPKDFIMTKDWNGPNTGCFFTRRSEWSADFLQLAWDQEHLVPPVSPSPGHGKHPFEYEQRAFHYLLRTRVWKSRPALPVYTPSPPRHIHNDKTGDIHSVRTEGTPAPSLSDRVGSSADIWQHFSFSLPQCALNSYSIHPLDLSHFRYISKAQVGIILSTCDICIFEAIQSNYIVSGLVYSFQFVDGDFIIHFAGKKGAIKMEMLKHHLTIAQQNFKVS